MTADAAHVAAVAEALWSRFVADQTDLNYTETEHLATVAVETLTPLIEADLRERIAEVERLTALIHAKQSWIDGARVDIEGLEAALAEARAEVERLRAKNTDLNRRLTKAEAHVATTIEDCRRQGVSIGRGLANAGYEGERARREAAEAALADLRRRITELCDSADAAHAKYLEGPIIDRFIMPSNVRTSSVRAALAAVAAHLAVTE